MVNGLIKDIIEKQKIICFLKTIKGINNDTVFFKDKTFTHIHFYIEYSLSEFGDPDLIIIAEENGKKHVIFIEAKTSTYSASASNIDSLQVGRDTSKVNIQLALKYRFLKALMKNDEGKLFTNEAEGYFYDAEKYWGRGRRLVKPGILAGLNAVYKANKYYLIALVQKESEDSIPDHFYPPIVREYTEDYFNECKKEIEGQEEGKYQFGIVTYQDLISNQVISIEEGCFGQAYRVTMAYVKHEIKSVNFKNCTEGSLRIVERLVCSNSGITWRKNSGSYSVQTNNRCVVAKIFGSPHGDWAYLGINTNHPIEVRLERLNDWKHKKHTYKCYLVKCKDIVEAKAILCSLLEKN